MKMISKFLYAVALVVVLAGFVLALIPDGPCGMDDDVCMAQRGWAPLIASIAVAAVLGYIGRALAGSHRDRRGR